MPISEIQHEEAGHRFNMPTVDPSLPKDPRHPINLTMHLRIRLRRKCGENQ